MFKNSFFFAILRIQFVLSMDLKFKRIRTKLVFWFLVLGLVPLVLGITLNYLERIDQVRQTGYERLMTIRDLKAEQIEYWVANRSLASREISVNTDLLFALTKLDGSSEKVSFKAIQKEIDSLVYGFKSSFPEIEQIRIYNVAGELINNNSGLQKDANLSHEVKQVINSGVITMSLIPKGVKFGGSLVYTIPVCAVGEPKAQPIGVVQIFFLADPIMGYELEAGFGLGKTGEVYLTDKNGYLLSKSTDSILGKMEAALVTQPAVFASRGEIGVVMSKDYKNNHVIAAYAYLPVAQMGIVVKQDVKEVNHPLISVQRDFIGLFLFAVILLVTMAMVVSESISRPIFMLAKHAERIQRGEFVGNSILAYDEIGLLARSFNKMEKYIRDQLLLQQGMATLSESMVGAVSLNDFRHRLIEAFARISHAEVVILLEKDPISTAFDFIIHNQTYKTGECTIIDKKWMHEEVNWFLENNGTPIMLNANELYEKTGVSVSLPLVYNLIPVAIQIDGNLEGVFLLVSKKEKIKYPLAEIIKRSLHLIVIGYSNVLASDQLSEMARSLTKTNQQLSQQTDELRSQSIALQESAKELQNQNIELEQQRGEVLRINKLKSEFLSNMSHEIRTPMHVILTLSGVLKKELASRMVTNEELEYLDVIERNGRILHNRINDVLDLSRIEAGKVMTNIHQVSVYGLIQNVVSNLQILASEKGVKLEVKPNDNVPLVYSDEEKLYHVFQNIIGNAIKFTDEGSVEIYLSVKKERILVDVSDTGIGIPDNQVAYVFDEFMQVDGSFSRKFQGSGLGLAIAQKLMHLLGGSIFVSSKLGVGSVFTVCIPVNHDMADADVRKLNVNSLLDDE